MRHCFYHTDLEQQNAVFDSFAIQIAIIQYSDDQLCVFSSLFSLEYRIDETH